MSKAQHKSWFSPLVAVLYGIVSISGIFMFFHLRIPGMHTLHEWSGIIFLIAAVIHIVLNWSIFVSYFRNRNKTAVFGVSAGIVLIIITLLIAPTNTKHSEDRAQNNYSANTLQRSR